MNENLSLVCAFEDSPLAKESGWYIVRAFNPKTLSWVDHARPGYGVTYWIKPEVAWRYGLVNHSIPVPIISIPATG